MKQWFVCCVGVSKFFVVAKRARLLCCFLVAVQDSYMWTASVFARVLHASVAITASLLQFVAFSLHLRLTGWRCCSASAASAMQKRLDRPHRHWICCFSVGNVARAYVIWEVAALILAVMQVPAHSAIGPGRADASIGDRLLFRLGSSPWPDGLFRHSTNLTDGPLVDCSASVSSGGSLSTSMPLGYGDPVTTEGAARWTALTETCTWWLTSYCLTFVLVLAYLDPFMIVACYTPATSSGAAAAEASATRSGAAAAEASATISGAAAAEASGTRDDGSAAADDDVDPRRCACSICCCDTGQWLWCLHCARLSLFVYALLFRFFHFEDTHTLITLAH
jgi:hypothetical protein